MAIFSRHSAITGPARPVPGELWWCSLCSDWSDCDQYWPLIDCWTHMGRVLTDLDSHLSQARREMTDPGPEVLSEPRHAQARVFAQCTDSLKTNTRHSPRKSFWPDIRYFLEASQKIKYFLERAWELQCGCNRFYLLFHSSWSDAIWLKSIVCMHIYVILIYTREGLCMYKMHRYSLVRLDFQLKSGLLYIHILRSG